MNTGYIIEIIDEKNAGKTVIQKFHDDFEELGEYLEGFFGPEFDGERLDRKDEETEVGEEFWYQCHKRRREDTNLTNVLIRKIEYRG